MLDNTQQLLDLLRSYGENQADQQQVNRMFDLLQSEDDGAIAAYLEQLRSEQKLGLLKRDDRHPDWQIMWDNIVQEASLPPVVEMNSHHSWWKIAAAAVVVLSLGIAVWWYVPSNKIPNTQIVKDISAPKSNHAVVILGNGKRIRLDSLDSGQLAMESNVSVEKTAAGQLSYQVNDERIPHKTIYNTVENPRGSKVIDMILSDGSRVWLNVGSSITYPVAFNKNERRVFINGEAYFEVANNPSAPFIATKGKLNIQVLGTSFNINGYNDEPTSKITLLTGKVKVTDASSVILNPGQQAVHGNNNLTVNNKVNIEQVIAWKNDQFIFGETTTIEEVMRQISRWYNVEVVYERKINTLIGGSISRKKNLSELLHMLELTGAVRFTLENNKIIVKPN